RLAGHRTGGREVYEVAPALRDPVRAYGTDWQVVLASTAETVDAAEATDAGRSVTAHPTPARNALVVGGAGQLTGPAANGARTVERFPLAAAARARPAPGSLWYEPWLGHLGGVPADCGELHLNTARVHARLLDGATVLTLLRRRRPTLVHVRPEGAGSFAPAACPRHGVPTLGRTP
ncbi:hypothetical protein, partial [Streptomyces nanshensis]